MLQPVVNHADLLCPDIDDSESNAKRVMLIGTAILTTIDYLVDASPDGDIRNFGFILGLLLEFVMEFEETCAANEIGWQYVALKKADQHAIIIRGYDRLDMIVPKIRMELDTADIEGEEFSEDEDAAEAGDRPNFLRAYKSAPYHPERRSPGVTRSWSTWAWKQEVCPTIVRLFYNAESTKFLEYSTRRDLDGKMGGRHYDLTIPHS